MRIPRATQCLPSSWHSNSHYTGKTRAKLLLFSPLLVTTCVQPPLGVAARIPRATLCLPSSWLSNWRIHQVKRLLLQVYSARLNKTKTNSNSDSEDKLFLRTVVALCLNFVRRVLLKQLFGCVAGFTVQYYENCFHRAVPAGSSSRGGDVTLRVFNINQPSLPTPFYSVLVSISLLRPFHLYLSLIHI